jgi:hypothetical protein
LFARGSDYGSPILILPSVGVAGSIPGGLYVSFPDLVSVPDLVNFDHEAILFAIFVSLNLAPIKKYIGAAIIFIPSYEPPLSRTILF